MKNKTVGVKCEEQVNRCFGRGNFDMIAGGLPMGLSPCVNCLNGLLSMIGNEINDKYYEADCIDYDNR